MKTAFILAQIIATLLPAITVASDASAIDPAKTRASNTIRVATYNLYNYFSTDRLVDGRWRLDYPKPESEKAIIQETILQVRPDILAVQEIGVELYLIELQADLARAGLDYPHRVWMEGNDGVRHLAVLSKIRPESVVEHRKWSFDYFGEETPLRRGVLEVSFPTSLGDDSVWRLFNFHLKSKWSIHDEDAEALHFRTREAEVFRHRVLRPLWESEPVPLFLIIGDFNDHPRSPPVRRFLRQGAREIARLPPTTDAHGLYWTHFWQRNHLYSTKDYILPSVTLFPQVVDGRAHIADHPLAMQGSDHRLVYLDLKFPFGSK